MQPVEGGVIFCRRGYPRGGRGAVLVCGATREVLWVSAKQEDGYSRAELPVMREGAVLVCGATREVLWVPAMYEGRSIGMRATRDVGGAAV